MKEWMFTCLAEITALYMVYKKRGELNFRLCVCARVSLWPLTNGKWAMESTKGVTAD